MSGYLHLTKVLAAVASLGIAAVPASAADLYVPSTDGYGYDGHGYYEDDAVGPPRYERYGDAGGDDFDAPYRPRAGYDDDGLHPRHHRYGYNTNNGCVPRHVAHERIRADGWRDFGRFEARGNLVYMQARRRSGRQFDLTVDTCTGEIIDARPLDGRRFDDRYAHEPRRRWSSY